MEGESNTVSGKVEVGSTGKSAEGETQGEDKTPVIRIQSAHGVLHMNTCTHTQSA